jgi:hypothetical protein
MAHVGIGPVAYGALGYYALGRPPRILTTCVRAAKDLSVALQNQITKGRLGAVLILDM